MRTTLHLIAPLVAALAASITLHAQTPDWMFALEGVYIGRLEMPDPSGVGDKVSWDARLDGRRNLQENGFVLQWMIERDSGVEETLTTWHWEDERVCETTIVSGRPSEECWLVTGQTDHAVILRRGGEFGGAAMLFERTVERLPGQLRITELHNDGSGKWEFAVGYVFEEMKPEASKH